MTVWGKKNWIKVSLSMVVTVSLISGSLFIGNPLEGQANSNDERIRQKEAEIAELERQHAQTRAEINEIRNKVNELIAEERTLNDDIVKLDLEIATTKSNIELQETEIAITEVKAYEAALELQAAEEQVAKREDLLKTRVRAMYESGGTVDYLEVLMGSSNFGEFLERLDFLSLLVQQDQKIVEDFIHAKELVEEKKEEIEQYLVLLEEQLNSLNALKADFEKQQKDKQVAIAAIQVTQEELAREEAEAFAAATALANQKAVAQKELEDLRWDGIFAWPVPNSKRITSHFGLRKDPFTGQTRGHNGMDIGAPQGTTIVAAASGVVLVAEYLNGYGNTVIVEHGDGIRTLYGHIRNGGIVVSVGDRVDREQKIAEVGSTGRSTGPHLHFEVHKNGVQTDPVDYLK
ncbi:murein DD-endopeptidase MepM/ murein hydrolase activator NlpD [Bacillus horti]|uniref:Murein DD-endopeptidase MepM/ murein hydrolase activator NlpD n=1 Tax=Caldalkalibacillus horti TaxID=77523 RepID=A0ABT9VZ95_9BACI|nr:murein DD-endopeptidase MepM/ murein hydrolase activator NlpD [Bacillus horti]